MKPLLLALYAAAVILLILPYLGVDIWGGLAGYLEPQQSASDEPREYPTPARDQERNLPAAIATSPQSDSLAEIESLLD